MRVPEGLLYGMDALEPWVALGVPVAMITVSVAPCYSPARQASQVPRSTSESGPVGASRRPVAITTPSTKTRSQGT